MEFVGILYLGSLLWYGEMSEGDCMFFYAANEGEEKRGVYIILRLIAVVWGNE